MLKQHINIDMVKKYSIICTLIVLFSYAMAIEDETLSINHKFAFLNEIYSDSWALIIGINNYQHATPLHYAQKDAIDIQQLLIEQYGFKESNVLMILDEDATKDNIIQGFNDILDKAKERDRVIIYFAGHGTTYELPNGGEMGFLIPVDGDPDNLYLSSIKMDEIYYLADMSYAKHILYLIDACYGGLAIQNRSLGKELTPEYLKKLTNQRGRQIITAGGKDEEVIENPKWGHSAFTNNLLKGLGEDLLADENTDGIITADELGSFIKNRVIIDVNGVHTPQKSRIGSDMGEFIFISENYKEDLAVIDDGQLSSLQKELAEQKEQMEQITELLLAQKANQNNQAAQDALSESVADPLLNIKKQNKAVDMKTAITLSWAFPGMGHYYSGNTGKGILFSGLELAALVGIVMTSNNYFDKVDEYDKWENNKVGGAWSPSYGEQLFQAKNDALFPIIGTSAAAGIIWLWNIRDIKKSVSSKYSASDPISIGINSQGQLEARISF